MTARFVNRVKEISLLNKEMKNSRLLVVYGRRRVGKTKLIMHWGESHPVVYSQAIEGSQKIQIEQIYNDIKKLLPANIIPSSWIELFELISLVKKKLIIVLDEFPYLVESDPSLPSILQKWLDHQQPDQLKLLLCSSSQTMMHSIFLDSSSPLFERANRLVHIKPMEYKDFAEYLKINSKKRESFIRYSIVGGIPKYWEFIDPDEDVLDFVDEMFLSDFSFLENEPYRLLKDENIKGLQPQSILEAIGRGASKPSEIASRLGIPQTSMGRSIQILMDASLAARELPFGESNRNAKKTLYHITDYPLRFYFNVYSPHRSRWHLYSSEKKQKIIAGHTGMY